MKRKGRFVRKRGGLSEYGGWKNYCKFRGGKRKNWGVNRRTHIFFAFLLSKMKKEKT